MATYDIDTNEVLDDDDLEARFDDFLNEFYGEVTMGDHTFTPSEVLKELDPIAYRTGFSDWEDSEDEETIYTADSPRSDDEDEDEDEDED